MLSDGFDSLKENEMDAGFPLSFAVNTQPDIHGVENRTDQEAVAFAELKAVLAKHGLLRKYGIALLHKHFDLAEDEIMVEYTDLENRTQTLKPTKVGAVRPTDLVEDGMGARLRHSLFDLSDLVLFLRRCQCASSQPPAGRLAERADGFKTASRVIEHDEDNLYISPPPDADGPYEYYLLGNVRPVRVTYNAKKRPIASEAPDPSDGGRAENQQSTLEPNSE